MGRVLLAIAAALLGAVVGAGLLAMALAIIFTAVWGGFEGSAAMGGVTVGLPLGAIAGFVIGGWLVLHFWKPAPKPPVG